MKKIPLALVLIVASTASYVLVTMVSGKSFPASEIERSFIGPQGQRIAYQQRGQGQDVLLIHGTPGSIEDWSQLYQEMDLRKYCLTSYDRPGHGASDRAATNGRLEDSVLAALQVISALNLNDAIVVGHSYGGTTALALAQRNDPRIAGAILLGPPAFEWNEINTIYYPLALPFIGTLFAHVLTPIFAESMIKESLLSFFAHNPSVLPENFIDFRIELWGRSEHAISKAREMVHLDSDLRKITPHLKNTRQPISILTGALDQPRIVAGSRRLAQEVPGATLSVLPNTGHYPQVENPKTVVKAIAELSTRHREDISKR